jgi:hypothetical protein
VTTEEIRLVIPAEEDFRPIAHLVTGGLATRLDVTYDDLDDLQLGIEAVLALRDDSGELVVSLTADDGMLRASLGPFPPDTLREAGPEGGLDLQRVLATVCDAHEIEERDGAAWVELSKRVAR